ncbi:MAG: cytidine deaminase [Firmicutes bacterium]|nr:cytidine deaminase [Bacillota bacterium]
MTLEDLAREALAARESAWAPFSGFKVGAAVLTEEGLVYRGCNVESAAYPLTNCAERVAIQKAVSEGHPRVVAVAVAADASYLRRGEGGGAGPMAAADGPGRAGRGAAVTGGALERFVTPCGACRQVIYEFGPDAVVVLADLEGGRHLTSARELLPGGFRLEVAAEVRGGRREARDGRQEVGSGD